MNEGTPTPRPIYLGFALVSLATLVYELLLTRVFSVTIWYHFAFFVISIALFGMALGAVIVYAKRDYFTPARAPELLRRTSIWFSATIIASLLFHFVIPFDGARSLTSSFFVMLTYIVMSVPFCLSGIAVAYILTAYARDGERLYAADLLGAAAGCLGVIGLLTFLDAPSAVFLVAALPLLAAYVFADPLAGGAGKRKYIVIGAILLVAFSFVHANLVRHGHGIFRPIWVKGEREAKPIYEKWNPISRIRVSDEDFLKRPFGWGLSDAMPTIVPPKQLYLTIDANAGTVLTEFHGATSTVEYLRYDIVNAVHVMRQNARVFVIGVGGGRDILSALAFGQRHVTGIEVNPAIINALENVFGNMTGHLERDPRVDIHNDEARNYLTRSHNVYDIIQISLIDTWAATAAGAFSLTENTLYTTDAWHVFLSHLSPQGILSVSRWFMPARPAETYRLLSLARTSLANEGIANPRQHLIMIQMISHDLDENGDTRGITTLLVSKSPYTHDDVVRIEKYADIMGFHVILTPEGTTDPIDEQIANGVPLAEIPALWNSRIDAPSDDDPFFFQTIPLSLALKNSITAKRVDMNAGTVIILSTLFFLVSFLSFLLILLPLRISLGRFPNAKELPLLLYFIAIGCGFILIEIAEMQRFIVFLGQPTYALSVVLLTLLLAAGIGSWTVSRVKDDVLTRAFIARFALVLVALYLLGHFHPLLSYFTQYALRVRIAIAAIVLFIPGFFMGMFFPLGMRLARKSMPEMIPWLWGVNGAMSVFASVLSPILAISYGFSTAFWCGFTCYAATFVVFMVMKKN